MKADVISVLKFSLGTMSFESQIIYFHIKQYDKLKSYIKLAGEEKNIRD